MLAGIIVLAGVFVLGVPPRAQGHPRFQGPLRARWRHGATGAEPVGAACGRAGRFLRPRGAGAAPCKVTWFGDKRKKRDVDI